MRAKIIKAIIAIIVNIWVLSSCGTEIEDIYNIEDIEEILVSQIDRSLDEFLASHDKSKELYPNNPNDPNNEVGKLVLEKITFGSFLQADANELLAEIKTLHPSHPEGLDRTIAAVYDRETLKIKTQHSFVGDTVELHVLPNSLNKILFMSDYTNLGYSQYKIEVVEIKEGEWISTDFIDEPYDEKEHNYYSFSNDRILHVFKLSYGEYLKPSLEYKYTLELNYSGGPLFIERSYEPKQR